MIRMRYTPTCEAEVVRELSKEEKTLAQLAALYEEIGRLTTQVTWLKRRSGFDPFMAGARSPRRAVVAFGQV